MTAIASSTRTITQVVEPIVEQTIEQAIEQTVKQTMIQTMNEPKTQRRERLPLNRVRRAVRTDRGVTIRSD